MDHLSPCGAAFLEIEDTDPHVSLAIGSVAVVEGPAPSHDEFLALMRSKVPLLPLAWVDGPEFDLAGHVRRTTIAAPAGDAELCALVARIMGQRLDRDRPLWEYWLVEGLARGCWAVVAKVHHCTADGVSGTMLYDVLDGDAPAPAEHGVNLRSPVGCSGLSQLYRVVRASLPDVQVVADAFGATVNDVLLAAVTCAYREVLRQRGDRTMVPVSVGGDREADDQVSLRLAFLPVEAESAVEALFLVHGRFTEAEDERGTAQLAKHEPFAPLEWAVPLGAMMPRRSIVTMTTNVPGPRHPLRVLGRRIVEILPYVPIAARIRTGISVLSYADRLAIGITADRDSTPEVDVLSSALRRAITDLVTAARRPRVGTR